MPMEKSIMFQINDFNVGQMIRGLSQQIDLESSVTPGSGSGQVHYNGKVNDAEKQWF